jgi:hypothetical protein
VIPTVVVVVTAGEAAGEDPPGDAAPDDGVGADAEPDPELQPASNTMGKKRHAKRRRGGKGKGTRFIFTAVTMNLEHSLCAEEAA